MEKCGTGNKTLSVNNPVSGINGICGKLDFKFYFCMKRFKAHHSGE